MAYTNSTMMKLARLLVDTTIEIPELIQEVAKTSPQVREIVNRIYNVVFRRCFQKRVRETTIRDAGLEFLLDVPLIKPFVISDWRRKVKPKPVPPRVPPKLFTKSDIIEFIKTYYTNPNTLRTYLSRYDNTKHKDTNSNIPDFNSDDWLDETFYSKMEEHKYFKAITSPIIKFIVEKHYDAKYHPIRDLLEKMRQSHQKFKDSEIIEQVKKTALPLKVTVEEIKDIFDNIAERSPETCDEKGNFMGMCSKDTMYLGILSGLYSIRGVRADFNAIRINPVNVNAKTDYPNYIDTMSGKIVIINHKTAKTYGAIEIEIPPKQLEYIKHTLTEIPRKYLICSTKSYDEPMVDLVGCGNNSFGKKVTRLFAKALNRKVTITDIRDAHVSGDFHNDTMTTAEKVERCNQRGHSVQTAMLYYKREETPEQKSQKKERSEKQKANDKRWAQKQRENRECLIQDD